MHKNAELKSSLYLQELSTKNYTSFDLSVTI